MRNSFERIGAVILRYIFLLQSSWPRIFELAFWPTFEVIIWGFTSTYFAQHMNPTAYGVSVLVSAALMWDFLARTQFGVSLSFMEEFYSRNLGHLFISPLRTWELVTALLGFSTFRALISISPAIVLAIIFFQVNLFSLGLPLVGFMFCLLMMGWWVGFFAIGIIVRFGIGTETLTWMIVYALAPICAVFYPVSVLPSWLQSIAFFMPASHIFEGMRAIITQHQFNVSELLWAVGLNLLYLAIGVFILLRSLHGARDRGALLVVGE